MTQTQNNTPDYSEVFRKRAKAQREIQELCPTINNNSGIYALVREENGMKFGYVGQAKHLLNRLTDHNLGFNDWIDRSIKSHKWYSPDNPTGYKIRFINLSEDKLNEAEVEYIRKFANAGYQLRNKTGGSQSIGKFGINDNAQAKGYREGLAQGELRLKKKLNEILDKYLVVSTKSDGKLAQNALQKFWALLYIDSDLNEK